MAKRRYRVTGEQPLDLWGQGTHVYRKGDEFTAEFAEGEEAHLIAAGAIEPLDKQAKAEKEE